MKLELPFEIGDTYYEPRRGANRVYVPCSVCRGTKHVTVIDGFEKTWWVECEACGKGYEGPTGLEGVWEVEAGATAYTIKGVERVDEKDVVVQVGACLTRYFSTLYKTEAEALAESLRYQTEYREQQIRDGEARNASHRKHVAWPVRYHNQCVKDYEKKIEWHRSKVAAKQS